MANLKGFKQATLAEYKSLGSEARKGYLWLVRELESGETVSAEIYFGNRLYANVGGKDTEALRKIDNIITTLGAAVDEDGNFLGFLPTEEHAILGKDTISDITDALEALESAILVNKGNIEGKVDTTTYTQKITELENAIKNAGKVKDVKVDGVSVLDENGVAVIDLTSKADKDDVYTKEEIDGKIKGVWHFKGDAVRINESGDTITIIEDGVEKDIVAAEENEGWVFQIADKSYASNAKIWVDLGGKFDLSEYAKKAYVDETVVPIKTDVANIENVLGDDSMPTGTTVTSNINAIIDILTVSGDDVED